MNTSVSITTKRGDVIRVFVSTIDKDLFPENIRQLLGPVEIEEVVLERVTGDNPLSLSALMQIAEILGRILSENGNSILYFYCDEAHDIRRRDTTLLPQHYRSLLFSGMYSRYMSHNNLTDILNHPITVISSTGNETYIHLIAREKHLYITEVLKSYITNLTLK